MPSKSLSITYTADAARALAAQKQIDAGHTRMQGEVSKTSTAFKSAFGSVIPLGYAAAGLAAVGAAKFIVDSAASEGEALNKAKVIFEDSAASVIRFSDQSASAFGISKAAALEAAGGFGAMYQSAGIAEQASANMSVTMVKLAGDMASFNNQDPTEMLERLRSGLAGEAEPLRQFGVFISEARVQQEAYRLGIAKVGDELTDAQKIQARYNIILQDTTKQTGDFGRTVGESLPNQIRVFTAELTDMAADIGTDVLPPLIELLKLVRELVDLLELLPVDETRTAIADLGGSLGKLGTEEAAAATRGIFDFNGAVTQAEEVTERHAAGIKQVESSYTDFNGKVHDIISTYQVFDDGSTLLINKVEKTENALTSAGDEAGKTAAKFTKAAKEIADGIGKELPGIIGTVTTYKETFTLSPAELVKITESWAKIARTIATDLRQIAKSDLTPAMRDAISALPPEMRHAWAEGNAQQRKAIQDSLKDAYDIQESMARLARQALTGGRGVGAALADGIADGIVAGSSAIAAAGSLAVQRAIIAARDAADARSPSREMEKLGLDMMAGLAQGVAAGQDALGIRLQQGGLITRPMAAFGETSLSGTSPLQSGGGNVYLTLNVAGSVIAERDLVEAVREGLVKTGYRNPDIFGGRA